MTDTSPAQQLVGAVLNGRFRLVRLLGEGGMGAVYEADSLRGEGKRAVKLLHQEFVKEEQVLQRFYAEAQATRALTHPNIAQVFDSGTAEDGTPYLVMELLQGMPLTDYMPLGRPIPPQQAGPIIYAVLQALSMAHGQRIVHRDLKPDNLFLVRDPRGSFVVKVLDFGIAKVMAEHAEMSAALAMTGKEITAFTPNYGAPEQFSRTHGATGPWTDVFAMALILVEILRGGIPALDGSDLIQMAVASRDPHRRPTPRSFGVQVPDAVERVFLSALAVNPGERYATLARMLRERGYDSVVIGGPQCARDGAGGEQRPHLGCAIPANITTCECTVRCPWHRAWKPGPGAPRTAGRAAPRGGPRRSAPRAA